MSDTISYPKHIPDISYNPGSPSRLQTVDVWLPRPLEESDPAQSLWIIYIHGGAWRDPTQTSLTVEPTLSHLFSPTAPASYSSALKHIAGFASLNYRLSPHPQHTATADADNEVAHPTHIQDVTRAIAFLKKKYGIQRWIGVGHSCGATLALQYVSRIGLEDDAQSGTSGGPEGLLLLEGIYSLPLILSTHSPPSCPPDIADIYRSFVAGAFGSDASKYLAASPVSGKYDTKIWPEGRLVMLCHSYADELVERQQRDVMCVRLDREGWNTVMEAGDPADNINEEDGKRRVLNVRDVRGGHDDIWEGGSQIAELIVEVVGRLVGNL